MPAQIKSALKMKYIWIFMDACPIFWVTFKILPFTQWKWKWKSLSCDSLRLHGLYRPWNSPDQNSGVGSLSLLQGIFPTQGLNPGLPHCRWILYQLSHKRSPRILEWVAYSFSSRSSWPRNWTRVFCTWSLPPGKSRALLLLFSH